MYIYSDYLHLNHNFYDLLLNHMYETISLNFKMIIFPTTYLMTGNHKYTVPV